MGHADVPEGVRELERYIDDYWRTLPAFKLPTESLVHQLLMATTSVSVGAIGAYQGAGHHLIHDRQRRAMGGLRWCLLWAFEKDRAIDPDISPTAMDILAALELGGAYEDVADLLKSCGADLAEARLRDASTVEFRYLQGTPQMDRMWRAYLGSDDSVFPQRTADVASTKAVIAHAVMHEWGNALASQAAGVISQALAATLVSPLPPEWSLGEYTFGEADTAWLRVLSVCGPASMATMTDAPTSVLMIPRDEFISAVQGHFANGKNGASQWLADLTWNRGEKNPNPGVTPFIELGDMVVTATGLVVLCSHQRNLTKSIASRRSRRKTWDYLKGLKESLFREHLRSLVAPLGWRVAGPILYPEGDIDALVSDGAGGVMLCELKWPIPADEVLEVKDDDQEFKVGAGQVARAIAWATQNWEDLRQRCELVPEHEELAGFVGVVLSRTTLPSITQHGSVVCRGYKELQQLLKDAPARTITELVSSLWMLDSDEGTPPVKYRSAPLVIGETTWLLPAVEHAGR